MLAARKASLAKIFSLVTALAICILFFSGCSDNSPEPDPERSEDAIRSSLTATFQAYGDSESQAVSTLASSIESPELEKAGISSEEIAKEVLGGFDVDVGDVRIEDDYASAEVYITCKDVAKIEQSVRKISTEMGEEIEKAKAEEEKKAREKAEAEKKAQKESSSSASSSSSQSEAGQPSSSSAQSSSSGENSTSAPDDKSKKDSSKQEKQVAKLIEELQRRVDECIEKAPYREVGPIVIEYEKKDGSWVPTNESRKRLIEAISNRS